MAIWIPMAHRLNDGIEVTVAISAATPHHIAMTPEQFVDCCAKERAYLLSCYLSSNSGSQVAADIASLRLSAEQVSMMRRILSGVLTDSFYTILLGLDGAASIGGRQEMYDLRAEDGTPLTGDGKLESLAYARFQESA
jgi:hypothetical protein